MPDTQVVASAGRHSLRVVFEIQPSMNGLSVAATLPDRGDLLPVNALSAKWWQAADTADDVIDAMEHEIGELAKGGCVILAGHCVISWLSIAVAQRLDVDTRISALLPQPYGPAELRDDRVTALARWTGDGESAGDLDDLAISAGWTVREALWRARGFGRPGPGDAAAARLIDYQANWLAILSWIADEAANRPVLWDRAVSYLEQASAVAAKELRTTTATELADAYSAEHLAWLLFADDSSGSGSVRP